MKLKNILFYLFISAFLCVQIPAQNTNPEVSKVAFSIFGTTVTVTYDVSDAEQATVTIVMQVSNDGGSTWNYNFGLAGGDIGSGISTGIGKTITWTYSGVYNDQFKIRIIANDETADGSPCLGSATVTDSRDGHVYNTIQIGDQCWLKENLDIGTRIDGTSDQTDNGTIEKYCQSNDETNCDTYGGLYQWAETVQYQNGATNTTSPSPAFSGNVQGICPTGWHIPTLAEFQTLKDAVNGNGNALKREDQGTGSGAGTNTSGFSALLAGYRYNDGTFFSLHGTTGYWSSTEGVSAAYATGGLGQSYTNSSINMSNDNSKVLGSSVRCVKD